MEADITKTKDCLKYVFSYVESDFSVKPIPGFIETGAVADRE